MNCGNFLNLDPVEQSQYVGQLVHVCMSDDKLFDLGKELIHMGLMKGLFERVKIGSEAINDNGNGHSKGTDELPVYG